MAVELKKSISEASNINKFASLTAQIKEDISFFGRRYIYAEGFKGRCCIDVLSAKARKIIKASGEFSEDERAMGKKMVKSIDKLYEDSDKRIRTKNLLTRIFRATVDFFKFLIYAFIFRESGAHRLHWQYHSGRKFYKYYTRQQYINVFGVEPKNTFIDIQQTRWESQKSKNQITLNLQRQEASQDDKDSWDLRNSLNRLNTNIFFYTGERP